MAKQLVEKAGQRVVASAFGHFRYPLRDALNAATAFGVTRRFKQHPVEALEYGRQLRTGVDVQVPIHALLAQKFVAVVAARLVDVELALCQPVARLGGTNARARSANNFPHAHNAVQVVVHFNDVHGGAGAGGADADIGGRAVNAARVPVPAPPVCVFCPRCIVENGARNVVVHGVLLYEMNFMKRHPNKK